MPYTLHGALMSTCARRVLICASVMGVDVKLVECDFAKIHTPEWAEHQPFNQMPYLVDDETGFEIYESRAIARYLAIKHKSPLMPSPAGDAEAYGKFEQAVSVEVSNFDSAASGLAFELVFAGMFGLQTDEKRVEKLKGDLTKRLQGYERILSKQKWVAGDKMTIADLFHLSYGSMVADLGVVPCLTDGSLPNVARWWKELSSIPEWAKLNAPLKK